MLNLDIGTLRRWEPVDIIFDLELTDPDSVARSIISRCDTERFRIDFGIQGDPIPSAVPGGFLKQIDGLVPLTYAGNFYYEAPASGLLGFSSLVDSFGVLVSRGPVRLSADETDVADELFASRFLNERSWFEADAEAYFEDYLQLLPESRYRKFKR